MKLELKLKRPSPTKKELLAELKRVAKKLKKKNFTQEEFNSLSKFQSFHYKRKFKTDNLGGWNNALLLAKLVVKRQINIPIKDLMDNLYNVWKRKGGSVTREDLLNTKFKSKYSSAVYRRRFNGWPNTLRYFDQYLSKSDSAKVATLKVLTKTKIKSEKRSLSVSEKLKVIARDGGYRCNECKRTKYEYPKLKFEFDHIEPYSAGGKSDINNIQILCYDCNRLKSNKRINTKK